MRSLKSLYSDVRHYSRMLANAADRLFVANRYPQIASATRKSYLSIARALVWTYSEIRRSLSGKVSANPPKISLESLERLFLSLENEWNNAQHDASRHKKRGDDKSAHVAQAAADAMAAELERVVKLLVTEADKLGRWTVQWERDLGIRQWLR
jgi:hypothetical protein